MTTPAAGRPGGVKTFKGGSLAWRTSGVFDGRPPLVLLHGVSFNRAMWYPALDVLLEMEPARQILSLDLPGHGDLDAPPNYGIKSVVGIVKVDQSLQSAGFAALVRSLADQLRAPGFMDIWKLFEASFNTELLSGPAQELLRSSGRPTPEPVT